MIHGPIVEKGHGYEAELKRTREEEFAKVERAIATGDCDIANVTVGESLGLVPDVSQRAR